MLVTTSYTVVSSSKCIQSLDKGGSNLSSLIGCPPSPAKPSRLRPHRLVFIRPSQQHLSSAVHSSPLFLAGNGFQTLPCCP